MEKKLILLILILFVFLNVFSQSKKNDFKVSVSALPLLNFTENSFEINGIVLKPSVGYYFSDKTSFDLNASFTYMNNINIEGINSYFTSHALIPSLRNNFINNEKLRLFGEIGFGLGTIKYSPDDRAYRTDLHNVLSGGIYVLNVGAGVNYYINDRFGFELVVPYIRSNIITSDNILPYSGIGPTIGITYKLN